MLGNKILAAGPPGEITLAKRGDVNLIYTPPTTCVKPAGDKGKSYNHERIHSNRYHEERVHGYFWHWGRQYWGRVRESFGTCEVWIFDTSCRNKANMKNKNSSKTSYSVQYVQVQSHPGMELWRVEVVNRRESVRKKTRIQLRRYER